MKAASTVQRNLRHLRRDCIEGTDDVVLKRIAYAIETAVRWAREDVRGWPGLSEEARSLAALLRKELS